MLIKKVKKLLKRKLSDIGMVPKPSHIFLLRLVLESLLESPRIFCLL